MNILERYIFKRAMVAVFAVLVSLSGVIWIIQALTKVDIFSSNGQSLYAYFFITLLVVPGLLLAIIPIALLIATAHTVNGLNTNSELVIISASGASNRIIVKPFIIIALICSLAAGFVGHFGMPWSFHKLRQFTVQMNADLLSVIVREGAFNEVEKGLTFHIAKRNLDGTLGGILVSDSREKDKQNIFVARHGVILRDGDDNLLQLRDGEIHQKDLTSNETSIIRFTSYAIDMATFTAREKSSKWKPVERTTAELFNSKADYYYSKARPWAISIEIHERFSEMFWPFANVLVILAFAGQAKSSRQGYGSAIFTASVFLLVLRGFSFGAQNSAESNLSMVYFMYVIPGFAIAFAGWYLFRNQQVAMPALLKPVFDRYTLWSEQTRKKWMDSYIAFRRRLAGQPRL